MNVPGTAPIIVLEDPGTEDALDVLVVSERAATALLSYGFSPEIADESRPYRNAYLAPRWVVALCSGVTNLVFHGTGPEEDRAEKDTILRMLPAMLDRGAADAPFAQALFVALTTGGFAAVATLARATLPDAPPEPAPPPRTRRRR